MSQIVILAGKKRSGKTTACELLEDAVEKKINGMERFDRVAIFNYADSLKDSCQSIFLLSDEQLYDEKLKEIVDPRWGVTPRRIMQAVGDLFRERLSDVLPEVKLQSPTIFVQNIMMQIDEELRSSETNDEKLLIIIADGRVKDELEKIKAYQSPEFITSSGEKVVAKDLKYISIKLKRDNKDPEGKTIVDEHKSEKLDVITNYTIDNNELSKYELQRTLTEIINKHSNSPVPKWKRLSSIL